MKKIRAVHVPYIDAGILAELKKDAEGMKLSEFHDKWNDNFISGTDTDAVWEHYQKARFKQVYGNEDGSVYFHWWKLANEYNKPWVEYVSRGSAQRLREMSLLGLLTMRHETQSGEDENRNGFRVTIALEGV